MPEPQLTCEQERLLANYVVGKREYNAARGKPSRWVPFPAQGCDAIAAALEELRALRDEIAVMRRIFADQRIDEPALALAYQKGRAELLAGIEEGMQKTGMRLHQNKGGEWCVLITPHRQVSIT